MRGVPIGPDVRRPLRTLTDEERGELEAWLESSVAGPVRRREHRLPPVAARRAATSCSRSARRSRPGRPGRPWAGSGSSSRPRPRCVCTGQRRAVPRARAAAVRAVGYLFLATTKPGWERLRARAASAADPRGSRGEGRRLARCRLETDDVLGAVACWRRGRRAGRGLTRELVRQSERARRRGPRKNGRAGARAGRPRDRLRRPFDRALARLPIRPLCRQLVDVGPVSICPPTCR